MRRVLRDERSPHGRAPTRGRVLTAAASALLLLAPIRPATAVMVSAKHLDVELVSDVAAAAPGGTFRLGVRFVPEKGWHVYWRNPGDSGEPPRIEWMLPAGLTAGALEWPTPERIPVGPLAAFGYPGEVLLAAPVAVARDVAAGAPLPLRAQAKWLVCNDDECIPGGATLALTLPVGEGAAVAPEMARLFAARALPEKPPASWRVAARIDREHVTLEVDGASVALGTTPFFFAAERGALDASAPQPFTQRADGFALALTPRAAAPTRLTGVLRVGDRAYGIDAPVGPPIAPLSATPLALAFAGGLLLNLMPCVFPVLAIKALALVGLGGEERRRVRRHGIVYLAGIVASFWLLAGVLIAARAGGAELGWGFQLQHPAVIAALAMLFFWMALVLLDVVSVGGSIMGVGQHLTAGGGDRAAFFTGVLATVVATPCTAPFMGTAVGYALGQPAVVAFAVFTSLGLGLAFPYVLVTWVPALASRLPRPGAWMQTLKQLLAFPLLATVVWLVWVASFQAGPPAVGAILMGLVLVGFAAWVSAHWRGAGGRLIAAAAVVSALALAVTIRTLDAPAPATPGAADFAWEPFSTARIAELRAQGRPVFVDFTAAWCVTCQVNKKVALETAEVIAKMKQLGVVAVRADWTRPDAAITRALQEFGRDGVPLYVLYSGRESDPPRILPQILTPTIVIAELEKLEPMPPRRST
ncbi:MAG: thioredoxin family protein [Deltaproteobacteria bacterium]|nr:thioredoxin family protein [Deltaproteobacteria bacterium]